MYPYFSAVSSSQILYEEYMVFRDSFKCDIRLSFLFLSSGYFFVCYFMNYDRPIIFKPVYKTGPVHVF